MRSDNIVGNVIKLSLVLAAAFAAAGQPSGGVFVSMKEYGIVIE